MWGTRSWCGGGGGAERALLRLGLSCGTCDECWSCGWWRRCWPELSLGGMAAELRHEERLSAVQMSCDEGFHAVQATEMIGLVGGGGAFDSGVL
ncbi:MAG: hypothetical protein R3B70_13330 [Polyangiaceae bacterium]